MNSAMPMWKVAACIVVGLIVGTVYTKSEPPPKLVTPPIEVEAVRGRLPNGNLVVVGKVGGVYGIFQTNDDLTYQIETMFDMEHTTKVLEMMTLDSAMQRKWIADHQTTKPNGFTR